MSLFEGFNTMRLVRAGPSLRERFERWIAGAHHEAVVVRLRRFRRQLERDAAPETWTALEAPMVLLLADLCNALGLNEGERAGVLGQQGDRALADILESRPALRPQVAVNERQAEALRCVYKHGKINLSMYRAICPLWSDETLRLDLADLVSRGVLAKNGRKRGTHYTLPELTA